MSNMAQNWVMLVSEQHRYQGVSYKSDVVIISGLDPGDRAMLEQKYKSCDPPCLLDTSDGRFVLKGASYNPIEVMNSLIQKRGYKMQFTPQQRTLPNINNKDDKFAIMYHLNKDVPLKRMESVPSDLAASANMKIKPSAPAIDQPDLPQQESVYTGLLSQQAKQLKIK